MTTQKKVQNLGAIAGIAAGVAAISAAGYFLFGPSGKNNRKAIKGWTLKMKGEVLEKIEKLKEITPEIYENIIDEVSLKYARAKHINPEDLVMMTSDLKKYWKVISRDSKAVQSGVKKKVASTKKAVKKTVRKVAKEIGKEATKIAEETK